MTIGTDDTETGRPGVALVTGAAGFIGSHLAARLIDAGWTVRGVDDCRTGDWRRAPEAVERIERDLADMTSAEVETACDGADVVFHLAAEKHNTPDVTPERMIEVNVAASRRLYAAAAATGVRKIVYTSSLYAYGSLGPDAMAEGDVPAPRTVYGTTKLAGEHLLRAVAPAGGGPGWSVARLFFVYGPRQFAQGGYKSVIVTNFERMRRGESPVVNGDGLQELDYVFVDDCVDALVALADSAHDGLTVNVASGRPVSVAALTGLMLDVAGSTEAPVAGPADWTAGTRRHGSTELAGARLGWSARVPLEDGLARVWGEST